MEFPINFENSVVYSMVIKMKVRDAMSRTLITAHKSDSLRSIQQLMRSRSISGVPIVEAKHIVGLISVDDILSALDDGYIEEPAGMHMTTKLVLLEEDMPLSMAISYINKYSFGRFPVTNSRKEAVGVLTSSDIINHLLLRMNDEILKLEESLEQRKDHPRIGYVERTFVCPQYDFNRGGSASAEIKKELKKLGVDKKTIRRIAVASYELEINMIAHSNGGTLFFNADDKEATIIARDKGPGIPDIEKALTEGFSTATDWIRSHGFGAGMGLPNVKRVADDFSIRSAPEYGTVVKAVIKFPDKTEGNGEAQRD